MRLWQKVVNMLKRLARPRTGKLDQLAIELQGQLDSLKAEVETELKQVQAGHHEVLSGLARHDRQFETLGANIEARQSGEEELRGVISHLDQRLTAADRDHTVAKEETHRLATELESVRNEFDSTRSSHIEQLTDLQQRVTETESASARLGTAHEDQNRFTQELQSQLAALKTELHQLQSRHSKLETRQAGNTRQLEGLEGKLEGERKRHVASLNTVGERLGQVQTEQESLHKTQSGMADSMRKSRRWAAAAVVVALLLGALAGTTRFWDVKQDIPEQVAVGSDSGQSPEPQVMQQDKPAAEEPASLFGEVVESAVLETDTAPVDKTEPGISESPIRETEAANGEPLISETEVAAVEPPISETELAAVESPISETEAAAVEPPISETEVAAVEPPISETEVAAVEPPISETEAAAVEPPISETEAAAVEPPISETEVAAVEPPISETEVAAVESPISETEVAAVESPISEMEPGTNESDKSTLPVNEQIRQIDPPDFVPSEGGAPASVTRPLTPSQAVAKVRTFESRAFFEENARKEGVISLPSGLQYKVLRSGHGKTPGPTDRVTLHYRGSLPDGRVFDSSYAETAPAAYRVDRIIPGWREALQRMQEGAQWELYIPPALARSGRARGAPGFLPRIYQIELISVSKAGSSNPP